MKRCCLFIGILFITRIVFSQNDTGGIALNEPYIFISLNNSDGNVQQQATNQQVVPNGSIQLRSTNRGSVPASVQSDLNTGKFSTGASGHRSSKKSHFLYRQSKWLKKVFSHRYKKSNHYRNKKRLNRCHVFS